MILNTLKLGNFRVFRGDHEIDLRPEGPIGAKPIILFGGLNGAGKTSILTAVRLTLYGRRILGAKVPSDEYYRYLSDCIHKPSGAERAPNNAYVLLNFNDAHGGRQHEYEVLRSWFRDKNGAVTENLQITRDHEVLSKLSHDQAQSFLNDLIPPGIADLFFFDGEKIAELAESKGNAALADAIKRLLGLDLVKRLRADLGIYIRNHSKDRLPEAIRQEAEILEINYDRCYSSYQHELEEKEVLEDQLHNLRTDIAQLEQKIEAHGGAWYENQAAERGRMERLLADQEAIKVRIRSLKGSIYPLALAPIALGALLTQLDAESNYRKKKVTHQAAKLQETALRRELEGVLRGKETLLDEAIKKAFGESLQPPEKVELVHDLSDSEIERLRYQITIEAPNQKQEVDDLEQRLEGLQHDISECATNLERAPDEQRIKPLYAQLHEAQLKQGRLNSRVEEKRENAKRELRNAMDCIRKLKKLEAEHQHQSNNAHAIDMAKSVREMLTSYSYRAKLSKINELEHHFCKSFKRLSRKSHDGLKPRIDPNTFSVELVYSDGKVIDREQLSAGEKQIYATAMLEALGKTSGRRLPIIIDTPLGRLDSNHRKNVIEKYFPNASHQVVLLSTDTEIDIEGSPINFNRSVSRFYKIDFKSHAGKSLVTKGYF